MTDDIFDFGFTAVTEEELEVVTELKERANTALSYHDRLEGLFNAIQPLLNNLKANPEKDYIYWPNRLDKVEQFEDHLQNIYLGKS